MERAAHTARRQVALGGPRPSFRPLMSVFGPNWPPVGFAELKPKERTEAWESTGPGKNMKSGIAGALFSGFLPDGTPILKTKFLDGAKLEESAGLGLLERIGVPNNGSLKEVMEEGDKHLRVDYKYDALRLIFEIDEEQHFNMGHWFNTSKSGQQDRDQLVNERCAKAGYYVVRIQAADLAAVPSAVPVPSADPNDAASLRGVRHAPHWADLGSTELRNRASLAVDTALRIRREQHAAGNYGGRVIVFPDIQSTQSVLDAVRGAAPGAQMPEVANPAADSFYAQLYFKADAVNEAIAASEALRNKNAGIAASLRQAEDEVLRQTAQWVRHGRTTSSADRKASKAAKAPKDGADKKDDKKDKKKQKRDAGDKDDAEREAKKPKLQRCWGCDAHTAAPLVCGDCGVATYCSRACAAGTGLDAAGHTRWCAHVGAARMEHARTGNLGVLDAVVERLARELRVTDDGELYRL